MRRKKLPARRSTQTIKFELDGKKFHASIGYYDRDCTRPGELFLNSSGRAGSETDMNMADAAIAISLALQHGCPLATLREACLRNSSGEPSTPIGRALDAMDDDRPLKKRKVLEI
jgi:ribonucleoside-diphosphate reductase alpha chain